MKMKVVIFSLFVLATFFFSGCGRKIVDGTNAEMRYVYMNQSGENIEIRKFQGAYSSGEYSIRKGNSLIQKLEPFFGDASSIIYYADSIYANFEKGRKHVCTKQQITAHDPLNITDYKITVYHEGKFQIIRYAFTFN